MSAKNEIKFVYSTYIAASPEKIWEALTDGTFTEKYWFGFKIEGDWKEGGKVYIKDPNGQAKIQGSVLKAERPTTLVYTWGMNPDWDVPEEFKARMKKSKEPTKVTFLLKQMKDVTKLTLLHEDLIQEDLVENPDTFMGLNNGWPAVLSSLKSLLETGKGLEF